MRAAILAACLMTTGSLPVATARWSDPATWGGVVPTSGPVVIPPGLSVLLDVSTASLGALTVNGTLLADASVDVGITAANIVVGASGLLQVGAESQRYTRNCTITLTGAENNRNARFVPQHDNPVAGKGKPARLAVGTGVSANELITLTFTSATTFTASSSTAGAMPSGTVGTYYSSRVQFMPTAGSTAWVAGDTVIISAGAQLGFTNDGVGRSLVVQPGGKLKLFGAPKTGTAILNANASSGATALTLAATPTGWASGDSVVIGPTDFYATASGTPHVTTLAANVSAAACTLSAGLNAARWGALQYPTDTGISLTPGPFTLAGMKASADVPTAIDERARIINKTRNIVIQGANDSAWSTSKFGAHVMVMGLASVVQLDGVEFLRVGQAGAIGRYPIHWHMVSYGGQQGGNMGLPSDGSFLGQIPTGNAYLRNCSIHTTGQRGTVIHGTHGVEVSNNVYHDFTAHCIFLEDSAEQGNIIRGNTIIGGTVPTIANKLLVHDGMTAGMDDSGYRLGSLGVVFTATAGIWYSHPNNVLEDNYVASVYGHGIWNAFATKPVGLCVEVDDAPYETPILSHARNTGACNGIFNMVTRFPPIDSRGNSDGVRYLGTTGRVAEITDAVIIKGYLGGYNNAVERPNYRRWTLIGNQGPGLSGVASTNSRLSDSLAVGTTFNAPTAVNESFPFGPQVVQVSYHGGLNPDHVSVYAYPNKVSAVKAGNIESYSGGGVIRMNDLYLSAFETEFSNGGPVKLHTDSGMGWFTPKTISEEIALLGGAGRGYPYVTLSSGIYDRLGWWGPAGSTIIRDNPFHTSGITTAPVNSGLGAVVSTMSPIYGIGPFVAFSSVSDTNSGANFLFDQMQVRRVASNLTTIGQVDSPAVLQTPPHFGNMRHHSGVPGGIYEHTWGGTLRHKHQVSVSGAMRSSDHFIIGIPAAGATVRAARGIEYMPGWTSIDTIPYGLEAEAAQAGSFEALLSATTFSVWMDTVNHRAWVHWWGWGGSPAFTQGNAATLLLSKSLLILGTD